MKKVSFIFLFIGLHILFPVQGKTAIAAIRKLNLRSPYDAVCTHFMLINNDYSEEEARALFMNKEVSPSSVSKKMVKDLKKLLLKNRVDPTTFPKDPDHIDPKRNRHCYLLTDQLPQIYLVKQGEEWLYSKETASYMEQYYKYLKIRNICYDLLLKEVCTKKLFMIEVWQYILFISMVVLIWLTHKLMPYLFYSLLNRLIGNRFRQYYTMERILFIYITLFYVRIILTILPLQVMKPLMNSVLATIASLILVCLLYEVVNIIQEWIKATKQHNKFIVYTLPLFSMVAKVFIIFIGFITVIAKLGFETKALTTILSVGTFGISFAAKDTIQNVFGSFLIMMDRPFVIGDEIIACAIRGNVKAVGLRATLLRTKEGSIVYIPNGKLADSQIDNLSKRTSCMVSLAIPVRYAISLELLTKFIEGLHKIATSQPFANPDKTVIHIESMQENGLVVSYNVCLDSKQIHLEQAYKNKIIPLILQLAHQLHVQLGKEPY